MTKIFKRIEEKYVITKDQYHTILPVLLKYMEYDNFCKNNNFYTIHNIYFDNENDDLIRHSISKPDFKEKLRVRSYTEVHNDSDPVFVEINKKYRDVVYKRRDSIAFSDITTLNEDKQVLKEAKYLMDTHLLEPKVFISYDRLALFGIDDNQFRLTFDFNVKSRRHNLKLVRTSEDKFVLDENLVIMEIKVNNAMELWLTKLLTENQIFPRSFSKYGNEYKQFVKGA